MSGLSGQRRWHNLDTSAINEAIEAANRSGGGTVQFHQGLPSYSIRLRTMSSYLDSGATILAASVPRGQI